MPDPQPAPSASLIPITMFDTCLIDGMTRADISGTYTRDEIGKPKAAYYLDKFVHHLKVRHAMDLKTYCKTHLAVSWPKCPGTGKELGYQLGGKGVVFSRYVAGGCTKVTHAGFAASCERMSKERKGSGNPMYGRPCWNLGLTAATDPRLASMVEKRRAYRPSRESIEKGRLKKLGQPSKTKGRRIHTDERREWFRGHTARLWQRGVFNRVTSIHIKVREFLSSLPLNEAFREEMTLGPFSVDFGFVAAKVAVEADGDYYHVNPQYYPNGPENAMQRRNHGRDKAKDAYAAKCGWTVIRCWEHDINSGAFKEPLTCQLRQSGLLDG